MKLLIEDDQGNRSVVPVIRDEITIGRKEGNTIRLTERNVSRRHARLVRTNGQLFVEDVEARYGVKINGQKIEERAEFSEGDVVLIGDYRLTLRPEQAKNAESPDANGAAHTEISPELQEEEREVEEEEAEAVEGRDDRGESSSEPADAAPKTQVVESEPAELVVVSSNFAGQKFPLDREEMVIGRGEECDIIIDHRSVSNTHAKVIRESADTYKIVDLNSRNGVKISGEEYKSVHLERGDIVELGHVKFRFVEPDENYVFEPSDSTDSAPEIEQPGSSINPVAVFGVAILVVAVFGGAYFLVAAGNGEGEKTPIEKKATAKSGVAAERNDVSSEEDKEQERTRKKVAETIEQAKRDIESGNLEKAIGALESTKNLLEPTREQGKRIDTLLSTARNEQPFRRRFESARQAIANDNYRNALEDLDKIPDHSVFSSLVNEKELREKALAGLIEGVSAKIEKEEFEAAKKQAKYAKQFESEKERASELLATIEEKQEAETQAVATQRNNSSGREPDRAEPASGSSGTTSEEEQEKGSSAPERKQSEVTQAEAERLFQEATKKWIRGDHAGALSDCRRAIRAGYSDCFRVMGMANKQMGDSGAACRNFQRYLNSEPSDAAKIREVMDEMGCP